MVKFYSVNIVVFTLIFTLVTLISPKITRAENDITSLTFTSGINSEKNPFLSFEIVPSNNYTNTTFFS